MAKSTFAILSVLLFSISAMAEPVRMGAILTYETLSNGKAGMGAEKCVPVQFDLQEDGTFQAHLHWSRDFGAGLISANVGINQMLNDGKIQYAYSIGFSYKRASEKSGTLIS